MDAGDSLPGAVTVAATGAVDEVTPLTRTKEVFLQTCDLPRAMDWVMVSLVLELRRDLSFLAIKRNLILFNTFFFFFFFLGDLWWKFFPPYSFLLRN